MKVRIVLSGTNKIDTYIIKTETSCFCSNQGEKKIDTTKFFDKFFTITKDWPEELEEPSIQDGTSCVIMFKNNEEEKVYMFHNKFPENFNDLINLLGGYENGSIN